MEPALKRAGAASGILHLMALLALLFMPQSQLSDAGDEAAVEMTFTGPAQRGPQSGRTPAASTARQRAPEPAAAPAPKGEQARPLPTPPLPTPPPAAPARPPPIPMPPVPLPMPVPLPTPPPRLQPRAPTPARPMPMPPRPIPDKPVARTSPRESHEAQDTQDLAATLRHLRAGHPQGSAAATAESGGEAEGASARARAGGAPDAGGRPTGNDNGGLSAGQRAGIAEGVRRCWDYDAGARDADRFAVHLRVITDAQGVAHVADIAPSENGHMAADPAFRAFAERARRAVLDPRCASLALPPSFMGRNRTIDFRFRP